MSTLSSTDDSKSGDRTNSGEGTKLNHSAIEEPSNPYYLHHSDSPGQVLVSQQLTSENYTSWSHAMLIALSVKNKLGFVDGSIPGTDANLFNSWIRNNNIVISWILNLISKEISASIIFAASTREIWLDLRDRFQQKNGPRIFQLKRELMNLRQDQSFVSIYFTKLKTIWEELSNYHPNCSCGKCSCGGVKHLNEHHQMEYIMSFLMGLDDSFSQVRGQLLLMDLMHPINHVFSLIIQEEQQRRNNPSSDLNNSTGTMAFAVKKDVDKSGGSNSQKSHNSNFSASKNQKRDRPYCKHCKILGHIMDRCYKIHGYPPGYKFRINNNSNATAHQVFASDDRLDQSNSFGGFVQNLNSNQYQQLMSMFSTHLSNPTKVNNGPDSSQTNCLTGMCFYVSLNPIFSSNQFWIIDSGATRHICSQANAFISLHSIHHTTVTLPNHSQILDLSTKRMIGRGNKVQDLYILNFNAKIKVFRYNNAPELSFVEFFQDKGVLHQFSCVERPQQNSVVERKHQHLLNVARSLFFQSRIPVSFWTDCVLTAEVFSFHAITRSDHVTDPFPDLVLPHSSLQTSFIPNIPPLYDPDPPASTSPLVSSSSSSPSAITSHSVANIPEDTIPATAPSTSADVVLRKSTKVIHQPTYLKDYHCNLITGSSTYASPSTSYPISKYISYLSLSNSHRQFVLSVSSQVEPQYYHQAVKFPEWRLAMQQELKAMETNNTWTVTPLPHDKHTIGCKWIYKIKFKSDGSIERHKARLVAKGYTQQEGLDFVETFLQWKN
ncbi:hypothetical protein UlMin_040090 [Ulmus minor]